MTRAHLGSRVAFGALPALTAFAAAMATVGSLAPWAAAQSRALSATASLSPVSPLGPAVLSWSEAQAPGSTATARAVDATWDALLAAQDRRDEWARQRISMRPADTEALRAEFAALRDTFANLTARAPANAAAWLGLAATQSELVEPAGALDSLAHAESLVGDGAEAATVLFRQGVEQTRLQQFDAARDVYLHFLTLPTGSAARSFALCNLAEIYTTLGDSERSIERYQQCLATRPDQAGGWWGLASALDRAGRVAEAHNAASRGAQLDPDLDAIVGAGVFFVPEYEVHYYLGLAYEAQGARARALHAWHAYLDLGGDHDRWAARARAHVHDLESTR